jgi:hypothetical protein
MARKVCAIAALLAGCTAADPADHPATARGQVIEAASSAPQPPAHAPTPPSSPATAGDFKLQMSRSGCYVRCPSYELTISGDGSVDYLGRSHVAAPGAQHGQADPQRLAALRRRLSAELPQLAQRYVHGSAGCGLWATDMPTVVIEFSDGGHRWRAEHDHGCAAAPAALAQLEQAIDDAAGSAQWTSGREIE